MIYVANNLRQLDSGSQPVFGDVTAIFSRSYVQNMVIIAPMDTGLYGMKCLKTAIPQQLNLSWYHPNCSAWPRQITGTLAHFDHLILPNLQYPINSSTTKDTILDEARRLLGRTSLAGRGYADLPKIALADADAYFESNILGNPELSRGVKFLIGNFPSLFATPEGRKLQALAQSRGWPLTWSLATSGQNTTHNESHNYTLGWNERILDPVIAKFNSNASVQATVEVKFEDVWKEAEHIRAARKLSFHDYQYFWNQLKLSQIRVAPVSAYSCADTDLCFATDLRNLDCISRIQSEKESRIVI
jgi:hypothetical protein